MKFDPDWQYAIRTRVLSLNIMRLMILFYCFECDYISSRINFLNSIKMSILDSNQHDEREILKSIRKLKEFDIELSRLIKYVREYFKWILLLVVTLDVICITIDIYWIYGGFIYGNNPNFIREQSLTEFFQLKSLSYFLIESCCCPWAKIVTIIVLFFSANAIESSRDASLNEIFNWKTSFDRSASSKRRLMLQHLQTSKIKMDANGFFFLNFGALIGVRFTNEGT